ncbi:MAG: hypothetical protein Q9227_005787 [Pyrenula ochraceoflavens]
MRPAEKYGEKPSRRAIQEQFLKIRGMTGGNNVKTPNKGPKNGRGPKKGRNQNSASNRQNLKTELEIKWEDASENEENLPPLVGAPTLNSEESDGGVSLPSVRHLLVTPRKVAMEKSLPTPPASRSKRVKSEGLKPKNKRGRRVIDDEEGDESLVSEEESDDNDEFGGMAVLASLPRRNAVREKRSKMAYNMEDLMEGNDSDVSEYGQVR